jgi:hypothetical protein
MRYSIRLTVIAASVLALGGCESHQSKIDRLQNEYDRTSEQFGKDCSAEYLRVPPKLDQKCAEESNQMGDAGRRLREERAKK